MSDTYAIEVANITKTFKVYLDKGSTLKERALFSKRRRYENRKVLNGISFKVKKGEAIGLIGHNGCGKSTTLKLLSKIMYPDSGTITMRGRVSSLIELGAGFHPDMSGRENIYINASIFGLTKKEIDARLDDIIEFSELGDYIENPVRTYSSGMYMRLAFSVAINVNADILLIDEILAVGDGGFQKKCFDRLKKIKADGTTIVIVSHSLEQISEICDRSIWIHNGIIESEGDPRIVSEQYKDYLTEERKEIAEKESKRETEKKSENETDKKNDTIIVTEDSTKKTNRFGNGDAVIKDLELMDATGKATNQFNTGENLLIKLNYHIVKSVPNAVIGIGIFRVDKVHCYGTNTRIDHYKQFDLIKDGTIVIELNNLCLLPGEYWLDLAIESGIDVEIDYWRDAVRFQMFSNIKDVGVTRIDHKWNVQ